MIQNFARKEYIQQFMTEFTEKKQIAKCYWKQIAETILDDVVKHINKNADPNEWDEEDVRRAVSRVILERLDIDKHKRSSTNGRTGYSCEFR